MPRLVDLSEKTNPDSFDGQPYVRRNWQGRKERENSSGNAKATDQISMDAFQSGSLHTNFSLVCNDLWFVARSGCGRSAVEVAGREKKLY